MLRGVECSRGESSRLAPSEAGWPGGEKGAEAFAMGSLALGAFAMHPGCWLNNHGHGKKKARDLGQTGGDHYFCINPPSPDLPRLSREPGQIWSFPLRFLI